MEIYNENMERIEKYDLAAGYLRDSVRIRRHEAVTGIAEQGHYEVIAEYENGGKDVEWVVDVPGVEAKEAWEEEIPIQVYVPYTQAELKEMEEQRNRPTLEERIAALERMAKLMNERLEAGLRLFTEGGETNGEKDGKDDELAFHNAQPVSQ